MSYSEVGASRMPGAQRTLRRAVGSVTVNAPECPQRGQAGICEDRHGWHGPAAMSSSHSAGEHADPRCRGGAGGGRPGGAGHPPYPSSCDTAPAPTPWGFWWDADFGGSSARGASPAQRSYRAGRCPHLPDLQRPDTHRQVRAPAGTMDGDVGEAGPRSRLCRRRSGGAGCPPGPGPESRRA